jgi:HAE1 family hydrophobic/amphiphilic exporter-1
MVRVKLPEQSALEVTDRSLREIEQALLKHPAVDSYFASVGGFTGQVNEGFVFVNLKPPGEREESQADVMQWARKTFNQPGGRQVVAQGLEARGFSTSRGFPVEFTLTGQSWDEMGRIASRITERMKGSGLVVDVDTDTDRPAPELAVLPDRAAAERRGLSVGRVAETVSAAFGGLVVGRYTDEGRRYDVRIKALEQAGAPPERRLRALDVRNNRSELVPLLDAVKIENRGAPRTLNRLNRERAITFFANVAPGKSQGEALTLVSELGKELPQGYRLEVSGTAQTFQESFSSLIVALILGIVVAYMVLATQFNSFADPISVLSALPFSFTGAFLGLLVTGQSLNLYSMIGLLLLMGIVKKNSILLVEFTNEIRDHEPGVSKQEALLKACPVRFRPIIMTSIATIAAAIPAAVALGPGAETRQPMAIAIIGGVLFSTILTLFVVPCLYSFLSPRRRKHPTEVDHLVKAA